MSRSGVHPSVSMPERPPKSVRAREEAPLVDRAREGDADARDALVRLHMPDVYRVTRRILNDPDLAEDAAQDAMINAIGALSRFRGEASFRTWLLRIAVNAARSVGRRQGRRREVSLVLAEDRASHDVDPATRAEQKTEVERVLEQLEQLPTRQRMVVSLRVQQGLSYPEIATVLSCTEGAARVNYHLGVKRLRELLR